MCGIAGAVNFIPEQGKIFSAMLHRGPDDQRAFDSGNVHLYHLRLSILDINCGLQPMHLGNRYCIIYNGEIYNHADLRKRFQLKGTTNSDTETILLLYEKLGPSMLEHFDGMFVFAIHDNQTNTLFIARDRAGKKPLYIFNDGQKIVFASELNCLKGLLPLEIDHDNFYHYTRLGVFYRRMTPYKQVSEMPGGTFLKIDCSNLHIEEHRWWNVMDHYLAENDHTLQQSLEIVDNHLKTAVRRRLYSSDLEVGCFLSGGIDSGLVTAIASSYHSNLKTFTVSFEGSYNEAPLASLVAQKYNTKHTEIGISFNNIVNDVEKILSNYGEPFFDSSAIPSYYVSKEAKKHVTVILNGDGADELFGGYRRYVPFSKVDFFKRQPLLKAIAGGVTTLLPAPTDKQTNWNYLYRLALIASKSSLEVYLSAGLDLIEDFESNVLAPPAEYLAPLRADFDVINKSAMSGMKKIMNLDFDTNLFSDLLVKIDIATMANSLEGRSPFLCKELLEYAPGMRDSHKIHWGTTKYLLRRLAKRYLPKTLVNQPKRGFEIPLKHWVDHQLKDMIHGYIEAAGNLNSSIIDPAFTKKLLANTAPVPPEKRAKILWMIFCMEVWFRKVYNA